VRLTKRNQHFAETTVISGRVPRNVATAVADAKRRPARVHLNWGKPLSRRRGQPAWYRFSFKIAGDWPQDVPAAGRQPCRTVIHQIKQDSFKDGKSCNASPFFKIEARRLGERVRFFAQVAAGAPCAQPPMVMRVQICRRDLPRESWTTVHVRLNPAHDASGGRVYIWLNGAFCGAYQGPMGDRDYGARRNGAPFINAQPRFGIYRDWRSETQTIYFDKIMFWNADPAEHPDWIVAPPPG
jgi:hypothetical protein